MGFDPTPAGTRGARAMPSGPVARGMQRLMGWYHRRKDFKFQGMDLLFLTTIGRKTGERRQTSVSWFADGPDAWLIVASAGGAAQNPSWYLNIAAHPDQVWIELPGSDGQIPVIAEQLDGARRQDAWDRITGLQPRYAKYLQKTDRVLPVLRLARADGAPQA